MSYPNSEMYVALEGKRLKRDIFSKSGLLIVPAMTVLQDEQLRILDLHQVYLNEFDVEEGSTNLSKSNNELNELINRSTDQIEEIFTEMRHSKQVPLMIIRKSLIPMINQSTEKPELYKLLSSLQSKDDYTFRHNIGVGVISNLLGKWMKLGETELAQLTIAATLHDVGKVRIPIEILNKTDKLETQEFELIKKHVIYGYEMLKDTIGLNHRQALVALQHHERNDGSGYPFGLRGDKIDLFSRIVAVADVFHAVTSDRPYRKASPFYETLRLMHHNAFGEFDPYIIHIFLDKMMQSLLGNQVRLTDGRIGSIVLINPHAPIHPLVCLEEGFLDLSKETSVNIDQVLS